MIRRRLADRILASMYTHESRTGWTTWATFAAFMMILVGMFQAIEGLVAIFDDEWYLVGSRGLVLSVDYTVWGWVHFALGILITCAGAALFNGHLWARIIGVFLALGSAVANLGFIAAYPAWSIIVIAIDVLIIWALTTHGNELRPARA
jgi:hypothetical protein